MFLVGLTGGIATGKSTVSALLREKGCPILDADKIAREVVEPGTTAYMRIVEKFGPGVLKADKTIDRSRLGEIIFSDPEKRHLLNKITHPEIYKNMTRKIVWNFLRGEQFVILDLPLLFETGSMVPYLTHIIVVYCFEQQQYQRLKARNQLTESEASQRIQSQLPLAEKCRKATVVVDNSSTREALVEQIDALYVHLCETRAHWKVRAVVFVVAGSVAGFIGLMAYSVYKLFG